MCENYFKKIKAVYTILLPLKGFEYVNYKLPCVCHSNNESHSTHCATFEHHLIHINLKF